MQGLAYYDEYRKRCAASKDFYKEMLRDEITYPEALASAVVRDDEYLSHYMEDFLLPEDEGERQTAATRSRFSHYVKQLSSKIDVTIGHADASSSISVAIEHEKERALLGSARAYAEYNLKMGNIKRRLTSHDEDHPIFENMRKVATRHLTASMLLRVTFETLIDAGKVFDRIVKGDEKNLQNAKTNAQSSGRTKERVLDLCKYYLSLNAQPEIDKPIYVFTSRWKLCEQLSKDFLNSQFTSELDEEFFENLREDHVREVLKIEAKFNTSEENRKAKKAAIPEIPRGGIHKVGDDGDGNGDGDDKKEADTHNAGHKTATLSDLIKANESAWAQYVSQLVPPKNSVQKILEKKK